MRKRSQRILSIVLLVIWMTVILLLSAQNKDQSEDTSKPFALIVAHVLGIPLDTLLPEQYALELDRCQQIVRTAAHMAEYAILAALCYWVCALHFNPIPLRLLLCMLFVILFSTTDESLQGSVSGRVCDVIDVVWDSLGAAIGLCCCFVLRVIKRNTKQRRGVSLS